MRSINLILSIIAILNLILILSTIFPEGMYKEYLIFGIPFAIFHLIYQYKQKEGIFKG
jgi:hypothetical protein